MFSRGRPPSLGKGATRAPDGPAGVLAAACIQGGPPQHGKPQAAVWGHQPAAREGQAVPLGVAERPVVPEKPGNAGGGKGPWFKGNVKGARAGRLA